MLRLAGLIHQNMADVDGDHMIGGGGTHFEFDETLIGGAKRGKRGSAAKTVLIARWNAAEKWSRGPYRTNAALRYSPLLKPMSKSAAWSTPTSWAATQFSGFRVIAMPP